MFCRSLLCHYVRNPVNLGSRLLCYTALSLLDVPTTAPSPPRPRPRALAPAPSPPRPRPRTAGTFCTHQHMAHPRAQGLIFYRVAASDAALADGQSTLGAFTFVMLISYLLPFAAIPIFVYDKQFYLRESGLGLYPTWAHTISQACAPAPTVAHRRHHSRHRCRPRLAQSHGATPHLLSGLLHAATGGQGKLSHTDALPPSCPRRRRFSRRGCSR